MSNTSRVLKPEEMTAVAPLWWNGSDASGGKGDPSSRDAVRMDAPLPPGSRERIEREAYERGFAEGQNMARAQAQAEAQPVIERMSRSLVEISSLRPRLRREAERDLVKLAIAIARRVLHRELTLDPSSLEGLIRVALEKLESRELCRVRVHPDQEEMLRSLLERFSNSHAVEVIPDKTLHAGDVLLETPHGTVDASVDAQLSEIERGFADRIQK
jgi:flagellar assembly protein FliH